MNHSDSSPADGNGAGQISQGRLFLPDMAAHSRHKHILQMIQTQGECSVEDLARQLDVSDMTIRRDLNVLAESGRVIRTHGGATLGEHVSFEFNFLNRVKERHLAKTAIARIARQQVQSGQTILLDSGTTTLAVAQQLKDLTKGMVITTSLPIASELQYTSGVDVLLLGGFLRRGSPDLIGPMTESNLDDIRADVAFIGADGVEENGDVFNADLSVAKMLNQMVCSAREIYIVADSSKLGRSALVRFGNLASFKGLITDSNAPKSFLSKLAANRIQILLALLER